MTIPLLVRRRAKRASSADVFRNPLPHPARIAVLFTERFSGDCLRVFEPLESEAIENFRPAILAGDLFSLRQVSVEPPALKAVVVFSTSATPEADRNWLWEKFQVPCFEQLLNNAGRVIAEECEAHSGLHVIDIRTIAQSLTSVECDCGRAEPRLLPSSMR